MRKTRFYSAIDAKDPEQSLRSFYDEFGIDSHTARRWLHQRIALGSPAYRRTRKLSQRLGAPEKHHKSTYKMLPDPLQNSVRSMPLEAQIAHHNLDIHIRTVQRNLKKHTNNAQKYRKAYVKKEISMPIRRKRVQFGKEYEHKTIDSFWQFVHFSDESRVDSSEQSIGTILREAGTRYNAENIEEIPPKQKATVHIVA